MRVYLGQTRSVELISRLAAFGFGECTQPRELPPRRCPWFLDNGAYGAYKRGRGFDSEAFALSLRRVADQASPPDFVVCPDEVGGGLASLEFSLSWLDTCRRTLPGHTPVYLVTQNGMSIGDVGGVMGEFDGIFVGGSPKTNWKVRTGQSWVEFAHTSGKPCHIGRAGTGRKVAWARRIEADSLDSSLPLWANGNLEVFIRALAASPSPQLRFWP